MEYTYSALGTFSQWNWGCGKTTTHTLHCGNIGCQASMGGLQNLDIFELKFDIFTGFKRSRL